MHSSFIVSHPNDECCIQIIIFNNFAQLIRYVHLLSSRFQYFSHKTQDFSLISDFVLSKIIFRTCMLKSFFLLFSLHLRFSISIPTFLSLYALNVKVWELRFLLFYSYQNIIVRWINNASISSRILRNCKMGKFGKFSTTHMGIRNLRKEWWNF